MNNQNFYILNLAGYDEYSPRFFTSEKSSVDFYNTVQLCFDKLFEDFKKAGHDEYYQSGMFLELMPKELERHGFLQIFPQNELTLGGSCYYGFCQSDIRNKPPVIKQETWDQMVEYNLELNRKSHEIRAKENRERELKENENSQTPSSN